MLTILLSVYRSRAFVGPPGPAPQQQPLAMHPNLPIAVPGIQMQQMPPPPAVVDNIQLPAIHENDMVLPPPQLAPEPDECDLLVPMIVSDSDSEEEIVDTLEWDDGLSDTENIDHGTSDAIAGPSGVKPPAAAVGCLQDIKPAFPFRHVDHAYADQHLPIIIYASDSEEETVETMHHARGSSTDDTVQPDCAPKHLYTDGYATPDILQLQDMPQEDLQVTPIVLERPQEAAIAEQRRTRDTGIISGGSSVQHAAAEATPLPVGNSRSGVCAVSSQQHQSGQIDINTGYNTPPQAGKQPPLGFTNLCWFVSPNQSGEPERCYLPTRKVLDEIQEEGFLDEESVANVKNDDGGTTPP